jgi:hypothetical protein
VRNGVNLPYVKTITGASSFETRDASGYLIDTGVYNAIEDKLPALIPGPLIRAEIVPEVPVISQKTRYRIIFTTTHGIPTGAEIRVVFPGDITVHDRNTAANSCVHYLTVSDGLKCSVKDRVLTVTQGFPVA